MVRKREIVEKCVNAAYRLHFATNEFCSAKVPRQAMCTIVTRTDGGTDMHTAKLVFGLSMIFLTGAAMAAGAVNRDGGQNDGPMQGLERTAERSADRFIRSFDSNKDGRITRAEMNNILGYRFAQATHRGPAMSLEQFMVARVAEFKKANEAMFHRLDWNGDNRLSLAEYGAGQRVRFVQFDRDGVGFVSCALRDQAMRGARAGLSAFCRDNDLNMDGRVVRAELDSAISKRFAQASGGSASMSLPQFVSGEEERYAIANVRLFRRLDTDEDGLLSIHEYAATEQATFNALDKNNDGVLSPLELAPRSARSARLASKNT